MNKIQTIINAVLGVAVITLTVLVVVLFSKVGQGGTAEVYDYDYE